ncbi:MAG: glycosyltransferase family 2 protein [Thermoleophilia bacterium]
MSSKSVACIIVNYHSPYEMLRQCLDSVSASIDVDCNTILVDNNSRDGVIGQAKVDFPYVRVMELDANVGFAAGVNSALEAVREPYVLLLNTDAILTDTALSRMVDALEVAGDDYAGVAPKMMSSAHKGVIDAIGTVMPRDGASFNRGIGQCDLGQYDQAEEVFGTCFGATLLRAELLESTGVGSLHEGYFLYFEDSDWCMRARSQGYRFLTAPDAVVFHLHSGVTRHETLSFKYRLIELNTLKIVVRTFESPLLAARIICSRSIRLLARAFIRRKFIRENLSILTSFIKELPGLLNERRQLLRLRNVSDRDIFSYAAGEEAFFDTINYRPQSCIDSLITSYQLLMRKEKDPAVKKILASLYKLKIESSEDGNIFINDEVMKMFMGETECVRNFIQQYAAMN